MDPRSPSSRRAFGEAFQQAFHSNPYLLQKAIEDERGQEFTPLGQVARSSPIVDLLRQVAPKPLGGYSKEDRNQARRAINNDPVLRDQVLQFGKYPTVSPVDQTILGDWKNRVAMKAAQAGGAIASDVMSQSAQHIWFLINAWQAMGMLGQQSGVHGALKDIEGAPKGSPLRGSRLRMATAFPSILAASAATGSLLREPGYKAVIPSEEDKTKTADPIGEVLSRGLLARTGGLLQWEDFRKERPDVTYDEYQKYKTYLFGNKAPIKATADGIHGPEVTFLGKSMPLLTGIAPLVGGAIGARMGARQTGRRLAGGMINEFDMVNSLANEVNDKKQEIRNAEYKLRKTEERLDAIRSKGPGKRRNERLEEKLETQMMNVHTGISQKERELRQVASQFNDARRRTDGEVAKGIILGSSLGIGSTAAAAGLLETIRRGNRAQRIEESEQD